MAPTPEPAATPTGRRGWGSLDADRAMGRDEADATAHLLKAVADPVRLRVLGAIRAAKHREACVGDLTAAVGLSQPTVSHHLKVLTEAGLLRRERRGTWTWYAVVPERLDDLASIFRDPAR